MSSRLLAAAGAAALLAPLFSTQALAFLDRDRGCATPQAVECYKAVQTPDLYTNRAKTVMVKPGWWETQNVPAVYGHRQKQVLVTPGQTVWHTQPAQYGTVHEQRVVRPGYAAWVRGGGEHRRDLLGDLFHRDRGCGPQVAETVCKVQMPAEVQTVERQVLVAREKRVAQQIAPTYQWVSEPYLIRPAKAHRHYHPPVYETVNERVLVQRGTTSYVPTAAPAPVPTCGSTCGVPVVHAAPRPAPCGPVPVTHPGYPAPRDCHR